MTNKILSASEWLRKNRDAGCPLHGFYISKSLVKYSGYCRVCNRYWRYVCHSDMTKMPYFWHYMNPETQTTDGKEYFKGYHNGKSANKRNKTTRP